VGNITTLSNLVTVGTLTSGSLGSGFTTVVVGRGGTGSTTLSQYNVLLGSTTNAIGIVRGRGTSGQFLTSQGDSEPPQWTTSAVDQALTYSWTGAHTFSTATTTFNNGIEAPLGIATSSNSKNASLSIELLAGSDRPALFIGDKGTSTPILEVKAGTTTFAGQYTLFDQYAVRARGSNTTATDGATTTVAWPAEDFDSGSIHDTSTNNSRLTAPIEGYWLITGTIELCPTSTTQAAASSYETIIRRNGSNNPALVYTREFIPASQAATVCMGNTLTTLARLNVNDYVELVVLQSFGVSATIGGDAFLSMSLIGK